MAKSGPRVGIDIEQLSIAGAQIGGSRQGRSLTNAAVRALPPGLMFEGEVVDVDGLAAELKSFWKASGFGGKRFHLGLANQKLVVRTLDLPPMDEKELHVASEFQEQEAIPIPLADAILDYQVVGRGVNSDGLETQKVLIVAAQKGMVKPFIEAAKKAGLAVDGIDLQAFALMRAMAPPATFLDEGVQPGSEATALVNIGTATTNLVVAMSDSPSFTRVVNVGCESSVDTLAQNRGINRDEADALRLTVGLSGPDVPYADLDPTTIGEIRQTLDAACEPLADEIRRSIDYYHSQGDQRRIGLVLLGGEGALTRNMCDFLARALRIPVALGNPMQHVAENKSKIPQAELEAISPRLAIALGLALDTEE